MLEQQLNGNFLGPCLIERACAVAIVALGLGAAVFLGAWGASWVWHFQQPELNVHISNPEVHLAGNQELTVRQDKPFKLAPSPDQDLNISRLLQNGKQTAQPPKGTEPVSTPKIIEREVTVFSTTAHGAGFVTTGWSFRDGSSGEPFRQYCYYAVPNPDRSITRVDIASDGARSWNANATIVPDLEMAVAKCQWWHH